MRLEIEIPDSTSERVQKKLKTFLKRLEAEPELIEGVEIQQMSDEELRAFFTPERLAEIEMAEEQVRQGHFYTEEEAEQYMAVRRAEWREKNDR
jgi:hypothetical protein